MRSPRPPHWLACAAAAWTVAVAGAAPLCAQTQTQTQTRDSTSRGLLGVSALPLPGSETETTLRLRELLGLDDDAGTLLRSVGSRITDRLGERDGIAAFTPELMVGYNSAHAWGFNDGPLRAGRGRNMLGSAGVALRRGRVTAVLVPQLVYEANLAFQTIPYPQPSPPVRNAWANPFYPLPTSMDYPQRFGDEARGALTFQGRVAVDVGAGVRVGLGHENRWWGPGVRNAMLLSANAPAFAQIFVESARPLQTRVGAFEYQWILGRLEESEFFDFDSRNDARSLNALGVTWRPVWDGPWPTLGVTRGVMARRAPGFATMLDVWRDVGRPWSRSADSAKARDQIFAMFSRWRFPEQGVEAYVEWARFEQVASLRDLLEQPGHMQGYAVGAQWAQPRWGGMLHFQTEFSYLEPSPSTRVRPIGTSYSSPAVPHGWTHQGQMLGPSIGPAASSQYFAADYRAPDWRAGLSLGRWRRDANYRFLNPLPPKREDLQLWASLRGGMAIGTWDALVEFTEGVRLNHLYQAYEFGTPDGRTEGVDLLNRSLTLTLTPRLPRVQR